MFESVPHLGKKIVLWGCLLGLAGVLIGCGKNEFSATTAAQTNTIPTAEEFTTTTCSNATVLKPKVDVVILWPNTAHAANWADGSIKLNLLHLLDIVSLYDYRVIGIPLIGTNWTNAVVSSSDGVSFGNFPRPIPLDELATKMMGFGTSNDAEPGIDRLIYTTRNYRSWHRDDAYTIFILVSFMDDKVRLENLNAIDGIVQQKAREFAGLIKSNFTNINPDKSNFLFSYVNTTGTTCFQYAAKATAYQNFTWQSGIGGGVKDICQFSNDDFFAELESKLQETIIAHTYDHWLVTSDSSDNIDLASVKVYKHSNDATSLVDSSRYTVTDYLQNRNTRCAPSAGEPMSGRFVKFPNCRQGISYPDCLSVVYNAKPVCYRYIVLNNEPSASTIRVWIDGQEVEQSQFSYVGKKYTTDITENCAGFSSHTPISKTGYFIRLNTPYQSGQSMKVTYKGTAK